MSWLRCWPSMTALLFLLIASAGPLAGQPQLRHENPQARRKLQMDAARALASGRYGSASTAIGQGAGLWVRYRGLLPVKRLLVLDDDLPTPAWAITSFRLRTGDVALRAPGILDLRLGGLSLPGRTFRSPFEVVEIYQQLADGQWSQLVPLERDPGAERLQVHRHQWGTGRLAVAFRLDQPQALLTLLEAPGHPGPELVFLHGVDGALSDYSGPRDVLAFASCFASRVLFFQYPSGQPIRENGEALGVALAARDSALGRPTRRILFGYSMGGLVARWALERSAQPPDADRLVLLASPSRGAEFVSIAGALPYLSRVRSKVFRSWPGVRDFLPDSDFFRRLNARDGAPLSLPTLAMAGVVDGNGDMVVDADSTSVPLHLRPEAYRHRTRADFLNLNRLSHWGIHQEFTVNGFAEDSAEWLELGPLCVLSPQERRWKRIRSRMERLVPPAVPSMALGRILRPAGD